jgi:hypothetical protein
LTKLNGGAKNYGTLLPSQGSGCESVKALLRGVTGDLLTKMKRIICQFLFCDGSRCESVKAALRGVTGELLTKMKRILC